MHTHTHTHMHARTHTHTHTQDSRPLTEVVVFVEEGDAILELISIKVRLHIGDLNVGLSNKNKAQYIHHHENTALTAVFSLGYQKS